MTLLESIRFKDTNNHDSRVWLIFMFIAAIFSTTDVQSNPIVLENAKPGTTQWQFENESNDIDGQIKGYASATSVNKGSPITFFVSVAPVQTYAIEIYRMGWYGGKRGRLMQTVGPLNGIQQAQAVLDSSSGLVTANWTPSYTLNVPADWTSGIYLAKLVNAQGFDNYIIFAVRNDSRVADFLYQQPVTTYQAYNAYPSGGIGKSLYGYNSSAPITVTGEKRAAKVSFDRPYDEEGAGLFFEFELELIGWLESAGYDIAYATNIDVHQQGAALLKRYKGFFSVGHDEYWSASMYDAADEARDAGVNLAFFGSNAVYWQIRMETSASGSPDRIITCYKHVDIDPIANPALKTIQFRDSGRAEQQLIGVQFITYNALVSDGSANSDFVVKNSSHPVYANTGLTDDTHVPKLVGYEVDGLFPDYPAPVSLNYTKLSESPFLDIEGNTVLSHSSIYQAPSGAWVFATGTMSWGWALGRPGIVSAGIQKMTANMLDLFKTPPVGQGNPIVVENGKPGSDRWYLNNPADDVNHQIKGYASATSVDKGDSINFHISVAPVQTYSIEIYRMGWYGGKQGRLMQTVGPLNGIEQPVAVLDSTTGLVTTPWSPSYTLNIPVDWTSGIYLAKLVNAQGFDNYLTFVVRDDSRQADFLYQQPVTTYQAYNAYPSGGIGKSLFGYNSSAPITVTGGRRAVKVSFDRPYGSEGAGLFLDYELDLISWFESAGYDVAYATNIDVHQGGLGLLQGYKGMLSGGIDAYWSDEMYDAVELARDSGINLGFLGENTAYWQMRLAASSVGMPNRIMICYKNSGLDPVNDPALKTIRWRHLGRAEQSLVGVQYINYTNSSSDGSSNSDFVISNSDHWAYAGTGFVNGSHVPRIVGYQADGLFSDYPAPVSLSYTKLSESPFLDIDGNTTLSHSSIYQAPSNAWVFASGTISWGWALNKAGLVDTGIQSMTRNVLDRFVVQ